MKTKFELLDGVIEQFGLTPKEVVDYLSPKIEMPTAKKNKKSLVIPTKKIEMPTIIPAKKFVTLSHIEAGMFHYAEENLIFPEIILELTIDSVIGCWDKNSGLGLCRDQEEMPWSSKYFDVDTGNVKSGFKATQMILDAAKKTGKKAEAAEYCAKYAKYGISQGQAFLFSSFEAETVLPNISKADKAFALLKDEPLGRYLWSSSERSNYNSWILCTNGGASQGGLNSSNKYFNYSVRPVINVTI